MCDQLVQLAQKVSKEYFSGDIEVRVVPNGSIEEKRLRHEFSLGVKGFVLAELVGKKILRFKHLRGIWKHFREPEKEERYLIREFSSFLPARSL